jgi:hypothetical protein
MSTPPSNMYGTPGQTYALLNNVSYFASIGTGLIPSVAQVDVAALADQGCMTEATWLKVQSAHPVSGSPSVGVSGTVQMADGAGGLLASQIKDTGSAVIFGNGQINTPAATPLVLTTDTGVVVGGAAVQGANTLNAPHIFANGVELTPKYIIGVSFVGGVLAASQLLGFHRFAAGVTIPANFGAYGNYASKAGGTANATASTVVNVDKAAAASPNTFSNIGTITFALGTVTPTFATSGGAAQTFAQGDVLRVVGPASPDATFANFYGTIVAHE